VSLIGSQNRGPTIFAEQLPSRLSLRVSVHGPLYTSTSIIEVHGQSVSVPSAWFQLVMVTR